MDESEDKIIVFESYDTVMTANLVKTKLDAYGIPCFLSDENFVGLYPIRNDLFTGVRLHIFDKDHARVKEIVGDQHDREPRLVLLQQVVTTVQDLLCHEPQFLEYPERCSERLDEGRRAERA